MFVILVSDVDEKRCAKILKLGRQYFYHIQNSVFQGEITLSKFEEFKLKLNKIIKNGDSVIIFKLRDEKFVEREVLGTEVRPVDNFL
ncbi:CRISPR-associated endonuclease Cas2 [bacterium]|nr:CRISPR-associated endonuclease Cas2 [bacterium]